MTAKKTLSTQRHPLIDQLLKHTQAANDTQLCKQLNMRPPVISKIRHGRLPVTPAFILNVHETLDVPVKTIRRWMTAA